MRTRRALVFSAIVLMAQMAFAAEDTTLDLGLYQVSFSLESLDLCDVQVAKPVEGSTPSGIDYIERSVVLNCDDGRAQIKLTNYHSPVPAGDRATETLSRKMPWNIGCMNVETKDRLVDRHTGFLTTFTEVSGREVYQVAYWLDRYLAPGDYLGETSCVISSNLPWTATKELIDTFHVEKVEATQKPSTVETVNLGPYEVSFDLGEKNYTIVQEGPEPGKTEEQVGLERFRIILDGGNRAATVEITSYDDFRIVNQGTETLLAEAALLTKGYSKNNASERMIDGEAGVLGIGEDEHHQILYVAIYWPDQVQTDEGSILGKTRCEIESSYWWDTTDTLLDTLHVERSEGV